MPDPDRSCKLALTKSSGKYYTSVVFAICRGENDAQVGADYSAANVADVN